MRTFTAATLVIGLLAVHTASSQQTQTNPAAQAPTDVVGRPPIRHNLRRTRVKTRQLYSSAYEGIGKRRSSWGYVVDMKTLPSANFVVAPGRFVKIRVRFKIYAGTVSIYVWVRG